MGTKAILATIGYKIKEDAEETLYRSYIARCVRLLTENTAKVCHGEYVKISFDEILHPRKADHRSAEEIVNEVCRNAGIEVKICN